MPDVENASREQVIVGEFYRWNAGRGVFHGRSEEIVADGEVEIPGTDRSVQGTTENPAVRLTVFAPEGDGFVETEEQAARRASALTHVDPLPAPTPEEPEPEARAMRAFARGSRGRGQWYEVRNAAGDERGPEVLVFDEVGLGGVTARDFVEDLRALDGAREITVRVNSPGGSVFEGLAIYNALTRLDARVRVEVDGLAASIASVIAMAGDTVSMPANALMMIHDPSGVAIGSAEDMRKMAEALDRVGGSIVGIYARKSGRDEEELRELMANETWFTAEEAVEAGLANEVSDAVEMTAAADFDLSRFRNAPEITASVDANGTAGDAGDAEGAADAGDVEDAGDAEPDAEGEAETAKPDTAESDTVDDGAGEDAAGVEEATDNEPAAADVTALLETVEKNGGSVADAKAFAREGLSADAARERLQSRNEIRNLCDRAGRLGLESPSAVADELIAAGKTPSDASRDVIERLAARSEATDVNTAAAPSAGGDDSKRSGHQISASEIYRQMNQRGNRK